MYITRVRAEARTQTIHRIPPKVGDRWGNYSVPMGGEFRVKKQIQF